MKKKWLILCFGLAASIFFFILFSKSNNQLKYSHEFNHKSAIIDYANLDIQPILNQSENKLIFEMKILSYMDQMMLQLNYKEHCVLEIGQSVISPMDWTVSNREPNTIEGVLTFNIEDKLVDQFLLKFFTLDETVIYWP